MVLPVFKPDAVGGLLPHICDETATFLSALQDAARTGELVQMEDLVGTLTSRVICYAVTGAEINSQAIEDMQIPIQCRAKYERTWRTR